MYSTSAVRYNVLSIVYLQASEIGYARGIAEEHTDAKDAKITDVVVLVPPHFGPQQRTAIVDAVGMTGMTLLSIMNTHAAAALQYGMERDFTGKSEDVIVYDVASTDVVAALVRYSAYPVKGSPKQLSQVQVLDVAWREGVGASFLDTQLLKHFAKKVRTKMCVASSHTYAQSRSPHTNAFGMQSAFQALQCLASQTRFMLCWCAGGAQMSHAYIQQPHETGSCSS